MSPNKGSNDAETGDQASTLAVDVNSTTVSLIICTFRRDAVLIDTINHLIPLVDANSEFLVIDQRADHDPITACKLDNFSRNGKIKYYNLPTPGLTNARNFGAQQATGEILLFCDDDIIPRTNVIKAHRKNYIDQDVAAVAGQVLNENEIEKFSPGEFHHTERVERFTSLYGANFSIRKTTYWEVGGSDRRLGIHAYTEDVLLAAQVLKSNSRIVYDPLASVTHLTHALGGCRITDDSQPTSEAEKSYSKLYLYHKLRHSHDPLRWKTLLQALRHGPLRKSNVIYFWRQPKAWIAFGWSFVRAMLDSKDKQN